MNRDRVDGIATGCAFLACACGLLLVISVLVDGPGHPIQFPSALAVAISGGGAALCCAIGGRIHW
jgi:hypothetical protein